MGDGNEQSMPESDFPKEKVSLQLPVEVVKKLEEIIFHAKQEMPRDKARQLTKSKLVELVMKSVIWEYEKVDTKKVIREIVFYWAED